MAGPGGARTLLRVVAVIALGMGASAAASAPPGRYAIASGAVSDGKTKLTWQQTASATTYTWADAKAYCQSLGTSLGGSGWRLPTEKELLTIVDFSLSSPAIDPTAFPATPSVFFWSSTPLTGAPAYAGGVSFADGSTSDEAVSTPNACRCVH
jgi:hypothetical protein